jgi:hypothetical protein
LLQAVATHVAGPVATASARRVADRRSAERSGRRCGGRGEIRADRCDELAGRGARASARCGRGAAQWTCSRGVCQGRSHALSHLTPPGCPSWRARAHAAALHALSQVRLGVIVWEASLTQPLGAYVQQYVEQMRAVVGNPSLSVVVVCNKTDVVPCPIPQLAGAPATCRALHTPHRTHHAPRVPRTHPRACSWCNRAWRRAAVHRSECGARHKSAPPLWALGAEPEQAALARVCEHGRPAREQHRFVVARRLCGPEEGLVWLGTARIWTAKVVDYTRDVDYACEFYTIMWGLWSDCAWRVRAFQRACTCGCAFFTFHDCRQMSGAVCTRAPVCGILNSNYHVQRQDRTRGY